MKSLDLSLFSLCFFSFFSFLLWDWFCLSKLSRDGRDGHQHQQAPPPQPPTDVFQCNKLPTSETKKPKLFTQNLYSWIIHLLRVIDFVRSLPELRKQRGCVGCQAFGASRPLDVFLLKLGGNHQKDVSIEHLPFKNLKRHDMILHIWSPASGKFFAPSTVNATSG